MSHGVEAETRGLLCFLLLRNHAMPTHPEQERFVELLQLRTFFNTLAHTPLNSTHGPKPSQPLNHSAFRTG